MERIRQFLVEEEGQDLAEYALLLALITLIAVSGIGTMGTSLSGLWDSILGQVSGLFGS